VPRLRLALPGRAHLHLAADGWELDNPDDLCPQTVETLDAIDGLIAVGAGSFDHYKGGVGELGKGERVRPVLRGWGLDDEEPGVPA
jgi:hypothetical protein